MPTPVAEPFVKAFAGGAPIVPSDTSYGAAFPTGPHWIGRMHIFSVAVANGLVWQEADGSALTSAEAGEFAHYNGAAWVKMAVSGGGGGSFPTYAGADRAYLSGRAGAYSWEIINEVPDTPGTATGVGSLLMVTGENDRDYAFRRVQDVITLSTGGGLAFDGSGHLHTSPSLVATAAAVDALNSVAMPTFPAAGSRDGRAAIFMGDALGWHELPSGSGTGLTAAQLARLLPTLPAAGSRDNRIPKFNGNVLGWELDTGGDVPAATTEQAGIVALARNADYDRVDQSDNTRAATVYGIRRIVGAAGFQNAEAVATAVMAEATLRTTADDALGTRIDDEITARADADAALATRVSDLARGFSVDPDYFLREDFSDADLTNNSKPRTYIIHVHPDDFPAGATHLALVINGNVPARAELFAAQTAYSFMFTTSQIQNILQNARSVVRIDLRYYNAANGGNLLGQLTDALRVVDDAPGFAPTKANIFEAVKEVFHPDTNAGVTADDANNELDVTGGGEGRELVVLADARSTDATGQATIQLPADYAEYENVEFIVGTTAGTNDNTHDVVRLRTAWLALQQDGDAVKVGIVDQDEAGSRQWVTWTPTTRTFGFGSQGGTAVNPRFKAARLYDGGPRGAQGPGVETSALANRAAYDALAVKAADTLYYWPRT